MKPHNNLNSNCKKICIFKTCLTIFPNIYFNQQFFRWANLSNNQYAIWMSDTEYFVFFFKLKKNDIKKQRNLWILNDYFFFGVPVLNILCEFFKTKYWNVCGSGCYYSVFLVKFGLKERSLQSIWIPEHCLTIIFIVPYIYMISDFTNNY